MQAEHVKIQLKQEGVLVNDWRLQKPFLHGFLGVLTFNAVELFPETWQVAKHNEPNTLAPGAVEILEDNKKIPFYLGVASSTLIMIFVFISIYRQYKYRYVIAHFKEEYKKYENA